MFLPTCLSSYQIVASHMSHSPASQFFGTKTSAPYTFLASSKVLATPSTPHTSILVGLGRPFGLMFHFFSFVIHENSFFFWFRLELFAILPFFHNAVRTARLHTPLLAPDALSLLSFSASKPSSSIAPTFASSSAFFSLPSVSNF